MSKKQIFIETVEKLIKESEEKIPVEALEYLKTLKDKKDSKPLFTEKGLKVLKTMGKIEETKSDLVGRIRAKDIAEEIFSTSGSVAGSLIKLVKDGYVAKGEKKEEEEPATYFLTEEGKDIIKNN